MVDRIKLSLCMVQLVIIIGIAYRFFDLAAKNQRNKWLFGILAAVIFFALQFLIEFAIVLILMALGYNDFPGFIVGLAGMGLALVAIYMVYDRTKKKWESEERITDDELLDS